MSNKFLMYEEQLYKELSEFHTWDKLAQQEIYSFLQKKGVTTIDGMLKHMFDYAFKCGIRRALDLIEVKGKLE